MIIISNNYNFGSKSDMNRFTKNLEKSAHNIARQSIMSGKYDVKCPHCKQSIKVSPEKSFCPFCRKEKDLKLHIKH